MTASGLAWSGLTEERRDLADTAARALASASGDPSAGQDLGWFGIGIDEDLGGSGGEFADLAPVIEAAGARCATTAVPWTTGVLARLLDRARHTDLLRGIAAGTVLVALPVGDPASTSAVPQAGRRVPGELIVHGAHHPTHLLVPRPGRLALIPADRVALTPLPSVDPSRHLHRAVLAEVDVKDPASQLDTGPDRLRVLVAQVAALDAVGAARAALDTTLRYAAEREQFGRPIGSFQAYQHRCATAFQKLKLAQSAAFRCAGEPPGLGADRLALAAALVGIADCVHVCGEAVQLHGAIGFSWESGLHTYLKRARAAQLLIGGGGQLARALLALPSS